MMVRIAWKVDKMFWLRQKLLMQNQQQPSSYDNNRLVDILVGHPFYSCLSGSSPVFFLHTHAHIPFGCLVM